MKPIICPTCKQNLLEPPHEGLRGKDCPQCGQGMSWRKAEKLRRKTMRQMLHTFLNDESGQDLVEYALLMVFLALAAIAILPLLGNAINNIFSRSASTLIQANK